MKYAHIDENNQLLGWYDTDIHTSIPIQNIEVTEDRWQNAIDNGHNKVNIDGTTEYVAPYKSEAEQLEELKSHFKSLYLQVFNDKLKELDYDSIATVALWANKEGSVFQLEAQSILKWYEALINYNYSLLNAGILLTDEEYLNGLPKYEA